MDTARLLGKWKGRGAKTPGQREELREGRPAQRYVHCERCGAPTDHIRCFEDGYWLCEGCFKVLTGVAAASSG
jgi:hypothetical protein